MTFQQMANSRLIWVCVAIGIILVVAITLYHFAIYYKHALSVGVKKDVLREVIKSSMTFSVIPSIAIVAGVATLSIVIGLPYSWFRLSVLGSVAYELMAADMALKTLALDVTTADGYAFVLVASRLLPASLYIC